MGINRLDSRSMNTGLTFSVREKPWKNTTDPIPRIGTELYPYKCLMEDTHISLKPL